ncbi:MAG TPA: protein kinase, partial [Bryobacteraceae bacterium]
MSEGLHPGARLGPYEIVAAIGAGGMGAVYRARDTRLDRAVAIKVLRPGADFDAARERLRREAKAISRLSHPHICDLYDIGSESGFDYLVMELLDGASLAARLKAGPLDRATFFKYAIAIADALDHAHRNGIIHRDLKPSNLIVTRAGEVKLLDFGLAILERPGAAAAGDDTETLESQLTRPGMVVGTLRYMSPEQLTARTADARSDIFAFGAVLYEMATGRKLFEGAEWSEIVAAVVSGPRPSLGAGADPALDRLIAKCLEKNPDDRWQTARDLRSELEWIASRPDAAPPRARSRRVFPWVAAGIVAISLLGLGGSALLKRREASSRAVVRLAIAIPEEGIAADPGRLSGPPAISPDGQTVVVPLGALATQALWIRRLDSDKFERLTGTEGGTQPFWSPDGRQIGFFARNMLMKMPAAGGAPVPLCEVVTGDARGAAWNASGTIVFGINYRGMLRVSDRGGNPVLIAGLDPKLDENSLRFPVFLPDGNRFVYFSRTKRQEDHAIWLDALDTVGKRPRRRIAVTDGAAAVGHDPVSGRYYLLFPKSGRLWAQHFDLDRAEVDGEPAAISEDVGQFSLSETGTLVYRKPGSETTRLQWFDRAGKPQGEAGQRGDYWDIALSPDDQSVAVVDHTSVDGHFWVSLIDLRRNLQTQFSNPAELSFSPVWSRDGRRIFFVSQRGGAHQIFAKAIDDAGAEQPFLSLPQQL